VPVREHSECRGREACIDLRRTGDFPVNCHDTNNPFRP
jgi:hypothetical protein